jgi:hypothetical protein
MTMNHFLTSLLLLYKPQSKRQISNGNNQCCLSKWSPNFNSEKIYADTVLGFAGKQSLSTIRKAVWQKNARDSNVVSDKLKSAIRRRLWEWLSLFVVLLHDNAVLYCWPHYWTSPTATLWDRKTFSIQTWSFSVVLLSVWTPAGINIPRLPLHTHWTKQILWTPRRYFKGPSSCRRPWAEGGGANEAAAWSKTFFSKWYI